MVKLMDMFSIINYSIHVISINKQQQILNILRVIEFELEVAPTVF